MRGTMTFPIWLKIEHNIPAMGNFYELPDEKQMALESEYKTYQCERGNPYSHMTEEMVASMSDTELIYNFDAWVGASRYEFCAEGQQYSSCRDYTCRRNCEVIEAEMEKRGITHEEREVKYGCTWCLEFFFEKYGEEIEYHLCEICGNALANSSGFCDHCEAELQEITSAFRHAKTAVQDYVLEKAIDEYYDHETLERVKR